VSDSINRAGADIQKDTESILKEFNHKKHQESILKRIEDEA
jgi:hypothetical protein